MVKIGVIGHTGRLGKPLVSMLEKHPYVEIVYTESRKEGKQGNLDGGELFFLALPYGESEKYIDKIKEKRIIDLSIDHRDNPEWVYGLPELNRENIKNARYVATPGCYATSVILGLAPIKCMIYCDDVIITSTSGISGAGLDKKEEDNFIVYNEGIKHPQINEMKKYLDLDEILFFPERADNTYRGIISKIFAKIIIGYDKHDITKAYMEFYKDSPFVRIRREKHEIETKNVNETNYCDIKIHNTDKRIAVISALDNLIKGGSGQAIQNMNIMYGFDETTGLLF